MTMKLEIRGTPLAMVDQINRNRTIPLEVYQDNGFIDRFGYLESLADEYGVDLATVVFMADDVLTPEEDFDGLASHLQDGDFPA